MPTLAHLLLGSTERFYSRLRAISVHISPEIYSQANIRDPSGGFKRQVLLLLKEGMIDSLRRPTSLLLGGRAVGFGLENRLRVGALRGPAGVSGGVLQGALQVGVGGSGAHHRLARTGRKQEGAELQGLFCTEKGGRE